MKQHKYDRRGLLAFYPGAFLDLFFEPPERKNVVSGDSEIVSISGPLEHHVGLSWCDSYDDILTRVDAALSGTAKTVVLKIDSPGGLVSGVFETARAIRAKAKASGKQVVAYVDGYACSAAYALACAADKIVASETGIIGSIGVIDTRVDVSAMDAQQGVKFAFVTSGSHKADGNPHQPMTAAELVEKQNLVNTLADIFFALVSDFRGVESESLEARVFIGASAKENKLVDEILSFSDLLAALASSNTGVGMSSYQEARAALEEAAKGDGEEAARAKRALAAMDDEECSTDSEDGEEAASDDSEDESPAEEEKDEEAASEAAVSAISPALAAALAAEIQRLSANTTKSEQAERKALLDSNKDLTPALKKILGNQPLAEVKAVLSQLKLSKPKPPTSTVVTPNAIKGNGQGSGKASSTPAPDYIKKMDSRMGLTQYKMGVKVEGNTRIFGAVVDESNSENGGSK